MVDKTLILRKITSLAEYQKQIGEYETITVERYRGDCLAENSLEPRSKKINRAPIPSGT